jgi:hypothetical protein
MVGKDSHPNSDNTTVSQKYMDKIAKMQQDQEKARQQEYELLQTHLSQMNILLDELIKVSGSGSTVASTKKVVPFQTGSQIAGQLLIKPPAQDGYPTNVDVYKINDNRTVPHMTLINDGPGEIFFINSYGNDVFNTEEGHLNVNDQRELFNVYEVRLRSTLPMTTFRLIEGIFRTGSTAPQTKINVEIRPTIQANQILKFFAGVFDNKVPTITITSPTVQTFAANYSIPIDLPPLPPGATATIVDRSTGKPMPFTIPEGFIFESFAAFANTNTDCTARNYFELFQGTNLFSLTSNFPFSNRGILISGQFNISEFSSQSIDPLGAPPGGRRVLITITNDDPFNDMIGNLVFVVILERVR